MIRKFIKLMVTVFVVNFIIGFVYGFVRGLRRELGAQREYNALSPAERKARLVASRDRFMCSAIDLIEFK